MMRLVASAKKNLAFHRLVPLRRRYFLTRNNRLRLRYTACPLAILVLSGLLWSGPSASSLATVRVAASTETARGAPVVVPSENIPASRRAALSDPGLVEEDRDFAAYIPQNFSGRNSEVEEKEFFDSTFAAFRKAGPSADLSKKDSPASYEKKIKVGHGDTLAGVLQEAGAGGSDAYHAIKALGEHFDPRKIRPGQYMTARFDPREDGSYELAGLAMDLDAVKTVMIEKEGPENFSASLYEKEVIARTYARSTTIQTSLYGSAARAEIPAPVIAEVIRIYSWNVDFQRDIRQGDNIEIMYNVYETEDGGFARYGEILYANLQVGRRTMPIYRFENESGDADYFDPEGQSIRKALMKTPIDGARMSSGFGMRRHPVLGYNKMHKGVDFAAPVGTPIYAAGDGTIDYAGRKGGYGNYIRIRHNGFLQTAYAHMHKFAKFSKKGARVKQGDIIGYVGTTGRSTGPHLHYEVIVDGGQVNPKRVDLPTGEKLKGKNLERFKAVMASLKQQYAALSEGLKFARHEPAAGRTSTN